MFRFAGEIVCRSVWRRSSINLSIVRMSEAADGQAISKKSVVLFLLLPVVAGHWSKFVIICILWCVNLCSELKRRMKAEKKAQEKAEKDAKAKVCIC